MKTSMQEAIDYLREFNLEASAIILEDKFLEKEKEQIQKAFSDGQETPINHPTLPHYSRDEYYNDNYKPETI